MGMADKTSDVKRISVDVATRDYKRVQREGIDTGVKPKNYFEEAIRKHFKALRDGKRER